MIDQKPYSTADSNLVHDEDIRMDSIKARFRNVMKRHADLTERLSRHVCCCFGWFCLLLAQHLYSMKACLTVLSPRLKIQLDSDKMIFERLQKEFEAALTSQTQEICLEGDDWNDGLLATIRERVHMEADRKASGGESNMIMDSSFLGKITYRVGNKVLCCLEGARIGIQYETSFAGEPCELYHCVLESKSFLEKMTVLEHTIPFFLPIREVENDLLSSNAMKFIDHVGDLLQAYVDRREQVRLMRELYGNQIGDIYHSMPYHLVEYVLEDFECARITVSLKYADLVSVLPTRVRVMAWPLNSKKGLTGGVLAGKKGSGSLSNHLIPARLTYAEEALRTLSLPEAFAEIVLNLPRALQQVFSS